MDEAERARDVAIKRLIAKRGFRAHAVVYVLVNLLLVIVWATASRGYF